jgi:hypothetical protein
MGGHPNVGLGQAAVTVTALTRRVGVRPRGGTPQAVRTPRPRPQPPAALAKSDNGGPPSEQGLG